MDLATAYDITTAPFRHVEPVSETAKQIVARARRQTDQAKVLGWWDAQKDLDYAAINLNSFMRGGVELEGGKHYAKQAILAATKLLTILEQIDP